jgi:hypothetical protein
MEKHISILGILHIARGGLVLLIGVLAWVTLAGIGAFSGDAVALGILGLLATIAAGFMMFLSLPSILAGIGLMQHRPWGRILALIVGGISLIDIPLGTALGVYTIWVLMDDDVRRVFEGSIPHQPAATAQPAVAGQGTH